MGVLGFPGVGWLFAGFPLQASVLLCAGPAFAWAVLPIAFSPFGEGPLRTVGWKIELVYLPVSALLSGAALYRAHRRRRLRVLGPKRPRRTRTHASYRTRVALAAGTLLLLLVSLPFVPAVAGIGDRGVRYTLQPKLTREVTGQFLVTPRGPVKLFSWQDPQTAYPSDALRLHATCDRAAEPRRSDRRGLGLQALRPLDEPHGAAHGASTREALAVARTGPAARHRAGTSSPRRTRECSAAATTRT